MHAFLFGNCRLRRTEFEKLSQNERLFESNPTTPFRRNVADGRSFGL